MTIQPLQGSLRAGQANRPLPGAASPGGLPAAAPRAADTVSFSPKARLLLAVAEMMAGAAGDQGASRRLQAGSALLTAPGGLTGAAGTAGGSLLAGGEGASIGFGTRDFGDHADIYAGARGSEGGDVIAIAAVSTDPRPDSRAHVNIQGNGGNDTITAASNGQIMVEGGAGDDVIATAAIGSVEKALAWVEGGTGHDVIDVAGNGVAYGDAGNDVIRLHDVLQGRPRVLVGFGGEGDDIITGDGHGGSAMGGAGNDTISGLGQVDGGAGDDVIGLSNSAYSRVTFWKTGFGHDVVTLSDPAEGIGDAAKPYFHSAQYDRAGNHIEAKPADAEGNYQGDSRNYLDVLPTEGQAGFGLAHTVLDFRGLRAEQVESRLDGTDLTLRVRETGDSVLVRNYQPGRVTFTFLDLAAGTMTASRQPPGLAAPAAST